MLRKLLVLLVLSLGLTSAAQAQTLTRREHTSPSPAWLPRGVFLGASFRDDTITPRLKVQWQFTFFQDRKDAFVFLVEGGLGWGASMPTQDKSEPHTLLGSYYEHTAQVGVGYRNHLKEGAHWGFQVTGGPVFYGAHFDGGNAADKRTAGIIDGRIQIGYQFDQVAFGVAAGYAEPFGLKRRSLGRTFVGGPMFGLFADWR
ncbi:hypothetical protein LZ198_31825 [Myxococcus sp. K15C18031901]|uniref:hypothetical protein n=1 Tax=Myxococcus dinghuensis TaxID=2906761 RepID=UPI0020A75A98|nr:hypothetical protein [Myxococcus dinghuensis]MCP3103482.1 hypothetical protein [Myxococcus dinghuensis]